MSGMKNKYGFYIEMITPFDFSVFTNDYKQLARLHSAFFKGNDIDGEKWIISWERSSSKTNTMLYNFDEALAYLYRKYIRCNSVLSWKDI
jgi:hypothetical protein